MPALRNLHTRNDMKTKFKKSKKQKITVRPDGSAFAIVPVNDAVDFIENTFMKRKSKPKR